MTSEPGAPGASETETRLRLALERLDRLLPDEEIAAVRSRLERQQSVLRQLRAVPLGNGDEPAPGFDPAPWASSQAYSS